MNNVLKKNPIVISNLHMNEGFKNWPFISKFNLAHRIDTDLLKKHDTIVFYTHPFSIKNITTHCIWVATIKQLLLQIKLNFNGTIYLMMPFKINRIEKFEKLKELISFCKENEIEYFSLNIRDHFAPLISPKQSKPLERAVLELMLSSFNFN